MQFECSCCLGPLDIDLQTVASALQDYCGIEPEEVDCRFHEANLYRVMMTNILRMCTSMTVGEISEETGISRHAASNHLNGKHGIKDLDDHIKAIERRKGLRTKCKSCLDARAEELSRWGSLRPSSDG